MIVDNFDDVAPNEGQDGFTWADAEDAFFADLYQGPGPVDDIVKEIHDVRARIETRSLAAYDLDIALGRIMQARDDAHTEGLDDLTDLLDGAESVVESILGRIHADNQAEDIDGYPGRGRTGGWASKDLGYQDHDQIYLVVSPHEDAQHQGLFVFDDRRLADRMQGIVGGEIVTETILSRHFVDAIEGKPYTKEAAA